MGKANDPRLDTIMVPAQTLRSVLRATLCNNPELRQQVLSGAGPVFNASITRVASVPMETARLVLADIIAEEAAAIIDKAKA